MKARWLSAPAGLLLTLFTVPQAGAAKQSWVLPSDCEAEQAAVRENGDVDHTGNDTEQTITFALEHPWIYRWSGKEGEYSAAELNQIADQFDQSIESELARAEVCRNAQGFAALNCIGWEGRLGGVRLTRLQSCAYRTAAVRRDQPAVAGGSQSSIAEPECAAAALAEANGRLQEIDEQVGAFLESPLGRQQGVATPALQVTMWGTSQQAAVIQQYCPQGARFQARMADLNESFKLAQRACRQIQSRPELCEPVAPKELLVRQTSD